jgi:fucose 4-O-acetylase-like acetyltransferase
VAGTAYLTVRHDLDFGPDWTALSFAGFLFFSALAQRLEMSELSRPLIWIGQRSIVFYVSHAIFIIVVARLAQRAEVTSYAFTATASVVISLAGGWALAAGMERWAPVGWLFTFPAARRSFTPRPVK